PRHGGQRLQARDRAHGRRWRVPGERQAWTSVTARQRGRRACFVQSPLTPRLTNPRGRPRDEAHHLKVFQAGAQAGVRAGKAAPTPTPRPRVSARRCERQSGTHEVRAQRSPAAQTRNRWARPELRGFVDPPCGGSVPVLGGELVADREAVGAPLFEERECFPPELIAHGLEVQRVRSALENGESIRAAVFALELFDVGQRRDGIQGAPELEERGPTVFGLEEWK